MNVHKLHANPELSISLFSPSTHRCTVTNHKYALQIYPVSNRDLTAPSTYFNSQNSVGEAKVVQLESGSSMFSMLIRPQKLETPQLVTSTSFWHGTLVLSHCNPPNRVLLRSRMDLTAWHMVQIKTRLPIICFCWNHSQFGSAAFWCQWKRNRTFVLISVKFWWELKYFLWLPPKHWAK